jgi:hypothetical protein
MQRKELDVRNRTPSVWDFMNLPEQKRQFRNDLYALHSPESSGTILNKIKLQNLQFWSAVFPTLGVVSEVNPYEMYVNDLKQKLAEAQGKLKEFSESIRVHTMEGQKAFVVDLDPGAHFTANYTVIENYEPNDSYPDPDPDAKQTLVMDSMIIERACSGSEVPLEFK